MGFHCRASAHKPKLIMRNAKCWLECCKACRNWTGEVETRSMEFGEGPFLFQHDNVPVHKARSIQKWFVEIGVEELDWPAQSPDLKPIENHTLGYIGTPTSSFG